MEIKILSLPKILNKKYLKEIIFVYVLKSQEIFL